MKLSTPILSLVLCAAGSAAAQDLIAIKAGRILTIGRGELKDAVILIENGKIKEVGADVEVPWNAKVIEAQDKVVMPTFILAHTSGGMTGENELLANVPYLTVQDAVDPSSRFFEEALRNGIGAMHVIPGNATLIGGQGMVVRPYGKTVEDMTVRQTGGIKLSLEASRGARRGGGRRGFGIAGPEPASSGGSRMAQIRKLRNALQDAIDYRDDLDRRRLEFDKEKAAGATDKESFDEEPSEQQKPMLDLLAGRIPAYLYVPSAAEIAEVARLQQQYGLKLVLVLGPECYRAADRIKELGLPVILDEDCLEYREEDPETGEEKVVSPAKVFADAGIEFALSISSDASGSQHYPWWQMGVGVRHGLDRQRALAAFTTTAARILGLDAELGSIEPGKVANLQILTGDPLQATSWVDHVLLEGEVVYDRASDKRLQHLFGKDKQDNPGNQGKQDKQ